MKLIFKAEITAKYGTRSITERKEIVIADDWKELNSQVINDATEAVKAYVVAEAEGKDVNVVLTGIEQETCNCTCECTTKKAEEKKEDSFMNPPVSETVEIPDEEQEFTNNVGEDVPEGFEMEELEDAPFKDTYYDSSVENAEEAPVKEVKEADYNEMQEKFLKKVSFLDRQKLMISKYDLLPSDKRCLRHPDAFPIAVENARNKGVLNDFYADIDKLAK